MNKLTQLTNECLANMPMLADVICHTTNIIGEIFGAYYDKVQDRVQQFLNDKPELKYEIDERNSKRRTIIPRRALVVFISSIFYIAQ